MKKASKKKKVAPRFPKKSAAGSFGAGLGKLLGTKQLWSWVLQGLSALILFQTLIFKFSGAEESKFIFTQMAMEPWGRYGIGVLELIASVLLLIPGTVFFGALLSVGLMSGAVVGHLTRIGIEVRGDHGYLFALALAVLIASVVVIALNPERIPGWVKAPFLRSGGKRYSRKKS